MVLVSQAVTAGLVDFDQTKWKLQKELDRCSLISDFDSSGFHLNFTKVGGEPNLRLEVSGVGFEQFKPLVTVNSVSPSWGINPDHALTKSEITQINTLTVNNTDKVSDILKQLQRGYWIQFKAADGEVIIPNTNINKVVPDFSRCTQHLPKTNWEDAQFSTLHFGLGQKRLSKKNKLFLKNLADFLKSDLSINRVLIDGYSDTGGTSVSNLKISKERASEVAYILASYGVDKSKLKVTAQGERFPVESNATEHGRDQNRRVEIRLIR